MARRSPSRPPPPAPTRAALLVALALGLAGVGVSIALTRLHADAHAGVASFCAISDTVNCDKVATSAYAVALGLPVSVWGILGFGLAAALAARGLAGRRPHASFPRGLLLLVAAASAATSVALALVSKLAIGAWCILCAAAWVVAAGILVAAAIACRPWGAGGAVRSDLRALRSAPLGTAFLVFLGLAAIFVARAAYPHYWEKPATGGSAAPAAPGGPAPASPAAPAALPAPPGAENPGPGVVVEYSDYECPFCARAHVQTKALLERHPQWRLERRHFPLDPSCNPAVKRAIHPAACDLAKAALCAEEQGRLAEMDDALFERQRTKEPVADVARKLGLDVPRLEACLASPDTDRALSRDVDAGVRDGVRATPTYVVGGSERAVTISGELPEALLAPPAAPADR
jgi:protein-disulfide isomerase